MHTTIQPFYHHTVYAIIYVEAVNIANAFKASQIAQNCTRTQRGPVYVLSPHTNISKPTPVMFIRTMISVRLGILGYCMCDIWLLLLCGSTAS